MFEITGDDIRELNDTDLRTLIGLLCEAELRSKGKSTVGVTWGGDQNAKDGGIDVRVKAPSSFFDENNFIPRSNTGFQVKKPDMPRSAIIEEMKPKGKLRVVIEELAEYGGAYIIVSSQSSTSDSALAERRKAMKEALEGCEHKEQLWIDFYDRQRIASWVSCHPTLIIWVREKIGRSIDGWHTYENWAKATSIEEEYILDNKARIYSNEYRDSDGMTVLDGINKLREKLCKERTSIRLVGLSGVGKTRLVQALFDERIGINVLNKYKVIYSDIGENPNPSPNKLVNRLLVLNEQIILIVDNCPPDLHRRLTDQCTKQESKISLLTVEYDIREDQPEETEIFCLKPSSNELIEKILLLRFDYISLVDVHTIANFSSGNARVALALAKTIKRGESLGNLKDEELFSRLFWQRHENKESLMKVAEVCSLVYSFNGEILQDSNSELLLLAQLRGMNENELFSNVSELMRRGIIQRRGQWRAVLPHAIANRLAIRALENIPNYMICNILQKNERLFKSFSRRLSYLHNCQEARKMAKQWLSEGEMLGDISNLNELGISIFRNLAPINPKETLYSIQRMLSSENKDVFFSCQNRHYKQFVRILCSLAYESELFCEAVKILCMYALTENKDVNDDTIHRMLKELFQLCWSGTYATKTQKLSVIKELIESKIQNKLELAMELLDSTLETWYFTTNNIYEFGARCRDYGYEPKSKDDVKSWYRIFIQYCIDIAIKYPDLSSNVKRILADKFRGLWIKANVYDELESAISKLILDDSWEEGWLAVKFTIKYDNKEMDDDILERLCKLERLLRPNTLYQKIRMHTFTKSSYSYFDITDEDGGCSNEVCIESVEEKIISLGMQLVNNEETYNEILHELLIGHKKELFYLGQGIAKGTNEYLKIWNEFLGQLKGIEVNARNYDLMVGFLYEVAQKDREVANQVLNDAVRDKLLINIFPRLQLSVQISEEGIVRLKKSLSMDSAPIEEYRRLGYIAIDEVNIDELCDLLEEISIKPKGMTIVIVILEGLLRKEKRSDINKLCSFGREILFKSHFIFDKNIDYNIDYRIANVIKKCFNEQVSENDFKMLNRQFKNSYSRYSYGGCSYTVRALAEINSDIFLDVFLLESGTATDLFQDLFSGKWYIQTNPILFIKDKDIISWCNKDIDARCTVLAQAIVPFIFNKEQKLAEWSPVALYIINHANNPIAVLNVMKDKFRPMSWSGSRAKIMEGYLRLFEELKGYPNELISQWAFIEKEKFEQEILSEQEFERNRESQLNQCFEYD